MSTHSKMLLNGTFVRGDVARDLHKHLIALIKRSSNNPINTRTIRTTNELCVALFRRHIDENAFDDQRWAARLQQLEQLKTLRYQIEDYKSKLTVAIESVKLNIALASSARLN